MSPLPSYSSAIARLPRSYSCRSRRGATPGPRGCPDRSPSMLSHGRMRLAQLRPLKGSFIGIRLPTCGFSACGGWARCPATQWDFGLGIGSPALTPNAQASTCSGPPRHVNRVPSASLATGRYISQVTRKMQVMSRIGVSAPFTRKTKCSRPLWPLRTRARATGAAPDRSGFG